MSRALPAYRPEPQPAALHDLRLDGPIALFARHLTAPNIVMLLMVIAGLFAATALRRQFFPDVVIERITLNYSWQDAPAQSLDQGLISLIQPELASLDGLDTVYATAVPGRAVFSLVYATGTDMDAAEVDLQALLSSISGLPDGVEDPRVRVSSFRDPVSSILISGPLTHEGLSDIAERVQRDLLNLGLTEVNLVGQENPVFAIELDPDLLTRHGLNPTLISQAIARLADEIPAGEVAFDTGGGASLRTRGVIASAQALQDLRIRSTAGTLLRLSDLGTVRRAAVDANRDIYVDGNPAITLSIRRGADGDAIEQQREIEAYLADLQPTLPAQVNARIFDNRAAQIEDRISLLYDNALYGILIVLAFLFVFLSGRAGFWIALGIPVSIAATLAIMWAMGLSINMLTLFALILSLGLIVDDAIVVGEYVELLHRQGAKPLQAAILGAQRMLAPVTAAAMTTVLAFSVLFFIGGFFGALAADIPSVVIAVLIASLIECFLVLPGHLYHALKAQDRDRGRTPSALTKPLIAARRALNASFARVQLGLFRPLLARTVAWRYPLIIALAGLGIYAFVMATTGSPRSQFFTRPETNFFNINFVMQDGASREDTRAQLVIIDEWQETLIINAREAGLARLNADLAAMNAGLSDMTFIQQVSHVFAWPGRAINAGYARAKIRDLEQRIAEVPPLADLVLAYGQIGGRAGGFGGTGTLSDPNAVGAYSLELVPLDTRIYSTRDVAGQMRALPRHPQLESIAARRSRAGASTTALEILVTGEDAATLKAAAIELGGDLAGIEGVSEVEDDTPFADNELNARLSPFGEAQGFDLATLGTELRGWLSPTTAANLIDGAGSIPVQVSLHPQGRTLKSLENIEVTANGVSARLNQVIDIQSVESLGLIQSRDGLRQVTVQAELDESSGEVSDVEARMRDEGLVSKIESAHGVQLVFSGEAQDRQRFDSEYQTALFAAVALIYLVLSLALQSFTRPLIVLALIPMGYVGMVWGHLFHGQAISALSLVGFLGLTGIIVNDSIVLVTSIDRRTRGVPPLQRQRPREALIDGTSDRLRPVLLTSLTTIGGLVPLLFETSSQAQFLIGPALTMIYGLAFGTIVVLILAPALYAVHLDIADSLRLVRARLRLKR